MEQLNDTNREYLLANSPATLPDDPSKWSPARIREKYYSAFVILFGWLKDIQKDGKDDLAAFNTFKSKLITLGTEISKRAECDKDGNAIGDTYATKNEVNAVSGDLTTLSNKHNTFEANTGNNFTSDRSRLTNLESNKLAKSGDTATALKVHQMDSSNDGVVNKGYVDTKIASEIANATSKHLKNVTVTENQSTGVVTTRYIFNDDSYFETTHDTNLEKIFTSVTLDGNYFVFTWANGQTTRLDAGKFMNVYKGFNGDDIKTEVLDDGSIKATFSSEWVEFFEEASSAEETRVANETARETLKGQMETLKTQMETLKTQLTPIANIVGSGTRITETEFNAMSQSEKDSKLWIIEVGK